MATRSTFLGILLALPYLVIIVAGFAAVPLTNSEAFIEVAALVATSILFLRYPIFLFHMLTGQARSQVSKAMWAVGMLAFNEVGLFLYWLIGTQPTAETTHLIGEELRVDDLPAGEPDNVFAHPPVEAPAIATPHQPEPAPQRSAPSERAALEAEQALDDLIRGLRQRTDLAPDALADLGVLVADLRQELASFRATLPELEESRRRLEARGSLIADLAADDVHDDLAAEAQAVQERHHQSLDDLRRREQTVHMAMIRIAQSAHDIEIEIRDESITTRADKLRDELERTSRAARATLKQLQR